MADIEAAPGTTAYWYAAPVSGGPGNGSSEHDPVTPASVIKVPVALAVAIAITEGRLDGTARLRIPATERTPGPVGLSLMQDDAELSVRDLLVLMMTISDNVATDALLGLVGLDEVNQLTTHLGLEHTLLQTNLADLLDGMAREAGYADFVDLDGRADATARARLAQTSAFDPARGTHTTPADMVRLLQLIWTDRAGPEAACAVVRHLMTAQLTRHRIAAGFGPEVTVAAKSGGLMRLVHNEIGVVTRSGGDSYAVAVFTRTDPATTFDPRPIDTTIGRIAASAVARLSRAGR